MRLRPNPKIVVIGGGTGNFTLLKSLKRHTKNITALVNMSDDGGSTGVLRDELGVLPPGDVRQCLVALSESSESLRQLFNYRFPENTSLAGHSFGNLFLSAVEKQGGDFGDAVKLASHVLNITGQVLPITLNDCRLVMKLNGREIKRESVIDKTKFNGKKDKPDLWLEPDVLANPEALRAIEKADLIVIAPGNIYISLIPTLITHGVKDALKSTKAKIVYVCNLVNKPPQTERFAVHDYVGELERFIGENLIDAVLYNTGEPSEKLLATYASAREFPVDVDESALFYAPYKAIGGSFLSHEIAGSDPNDSLHKRTLIRHDGEAVSKALLDLVS